MNLVNNICHIKAMLNMELFCTRMQPGGVCLILYDEHQKPLNSKDNVGKTACVCECLCLDYYSIWKTF